jgi:hypothetical protein
MSEESAEMDRLARDVRAALETSDPTNFAALLDPNVTWGAPGARTPTCHNRDQVLSWYRRGQESGVRASVSEVAVFGDRLLITMTVRGTDSGRERGGAAMRWQVLTVRGGLVVNIVGFDDRADALAQIEPPSS